MRIRDATDTLVIVRGNEVVIYLDEDNTVRMPVKVWRQLNAEIERKVQR